ncbi:MAG: hypothetical protein AAF788_06880 [Pseudomonadota bacterium]
MASAENWCMNVSGRIFGPYDTAQMERFVLEKRLAYHSLVAPAGSRDFRPALQFPELRDYFKPARGGAADSSSQAPVRSSGNSGAKAFIIAFGTEAGGAEKASRLQGTFDNVLPLSATTWLVETGKSADAIRDELAKVLPTTERAIVIACASQAPACHGVSLEEYERMNKALQTASLWARA